MLEDLDHLVSFNSAVDAHLRSVLGQNDPNKPIPKAQLSFWWQRLYDLIKMCGVHKFEGVSEILDRIHQDYHFAPCGELDIRLKEAQRQYDYECQRRRLYLIDYEKGKTLEGDFNELLRDRFPSAIEDIREAKLCFVLDRWRACLFHSVRAAEWGLKALARASGVKGSLDFKEWGKIIHNIEQKTGPIVLWQNGPAKSNALEFYTSALSDVRALKDVHRNVNFHVKANVACTEGDSKKAYNLAHAFLLTVASRSNEKQKRALTKRSLAKTVPRPEHRDEF